MGSQRITLATGVLIMVCGAGAVLAPIESVSGADLRASVQMIGVGTHNCGQYLENTKGAQGEDYRNLYVTWAWGFISGANWHGSEHQSRPPDSATVSAFIDNFCRRNPLLGVAGATIALVGETGGRDVKLKHEK